MAFKLNVGNKGNFWENASFKELNLLTRYDKLVLLTFVISFLASVIGLFIVVKVWNVSILNASMILSLPFFLLGIFWYYRSRKWMTLVFIVVLSIILYLFLHSGFDFNKESFLKMDVLLAFVIGFIFIGSVGVVVFVSSFQRLVFYRVVSLVQSMNIRDEMTIQEKLVAFLFNVPNDIDTRNLTMDYNLKRASIPWSEIRETMTMGLMIGIFLWIYISMSPKFASAGMFSSAPIYIFAIVLYIPVIVMPWSIFNALHVRVETKYRDFMLYEGIKGTIKRMILPMFAALLYLLIAISENDIMTVISFIATSVVMIIVIIGFTSALYYAYFENKLVDDIVSKWKVFRPVSLLMTVGNDAVRKRESPGTPKRDMSDYNKLSSSEESHE